MVHQHIDSAKKSEIQNQSLNETKTTGITADTKRSISETEAKEFENTDSEMTSKSKLKSDSKSKSSSTSKTPKVVRNMDPPPTSTDSTATKMDEDSESDGEAPIGNGGSTDSYVWTQSLEEVELMVDIDANLRGKHLRIDIKRTHLTVAVKGKESEPIIDGDLHDAVDVEDSTWTMTKESGKDTKTLTIILQKVKGMCWWKRVIVGDPEIDTTKIQPENSKLDSLDDETRQTVEKMMYDQRQKAKGLPTSKEMEQQKILEKFKAQHPEMDFSNLKMAPDSLNKFTQ